MILGLCRHWLFRWQKEETLPNKKPHATRVTKDYQRHGRTGCHQAGATRSVQAVPLPHPAPECSFQQLSLVYCTCLGSSHHITSEMSQSVSLIPHCKVVDNKSTGSDGLLGVCCAGPLQEHTSSGDLHSHYFFPLTQQPRGTWIRPLWML